MRPVNVIRLLCALTIAFGLAAPFTARSQPQVDSAAVPASGCDRVALR